MAGDKNNTVLEYTVLVLNQEAVEARPDDLIVGVVMLIVDETGQVHQADLLAAEAMRDRIVRSRVRLQ